MRRLKRVLGVSISAALLGVALGAGNVSAVIKASNWDNLYGCDGFLYSNKWCGYLDMKAKWDTYIGFEHGTQFVVVRNFEMYALLENGKNAWGYGVRPKDVTWNFKIKTDAGTVLRTVYPPYEECYAKLEGLNDLSWQRCMIPAMEVPLTATKVTLNFMVDDGNVAGAGWQKSWTANLR